jgi:hypothetical protein
VVQTRRSSNSCLDGNFNALQTNYSSLQKECSSLQALIATKDKPQPSPSGLSNKPTKWKPGEPEIVELNGTTWKWCAKCFNGAWTRTHITAEHVRGRGRQQHRQPPPDSNNNDNNNTSTPTPQANLSTTPTDPTYSQILQANISASTSYDVDFM